MVPRENEMGIIEVNPLEAVRRQAELVVKPDATPLDFLKSVYTNEAVALHVRVKCAVEAAQYVHPRLAMIATANANGDFGVMLERAIAASNSAREPRLIEGEVLSKPNGHPSPEAVSSSRMSKSFPTRRRF